jgi:two-component system, cell cycle sensor histidine kinase and response regulator CckA
MTLFAAQAKETDAPMPAVNSKTILLVEDEEIVREPATRFLEAQGYRVLPTASPMEALVVASHHLDIDLLLTDVVMPEMSGKELAQKLLDSKPNLQILFMSGYTQDVIGSHGADESGIKLIEKPFTAERLLSTVRQVLDHAEIEA